MLEPEGVLLDGPQIRRYLVEVADELAPGPECVLILAGGSLLALTGLRDSTRDVDSITGLTGELREAAASVAARHGLRTTWLNDRAAMFWPEGLTENLCTVLFERGRLRVLSPPLAYVFAMKLEASRQTDLPDLRRLWPMTGLADEEQAVALWRSAYPNSPDDPHLAEFIRRVISNP